MGVGYKLYISYRQKMDKIQEDLKEIERDVEQIDCHPIVKFFMDCMKCVQDTIAYCFKPKTNDVIILSQI